MVDSFDPGKILVSAEQAGQPVQPVSPASVEQPSAGARVDEGLIGAVKSEIAKALSEALEAQTRKQQSLLDKLESRVNKQIGILKAANIDVTPEIRKQISDAARQDMTAEEAPQGNVSAAFPAQGTKPETKPTPAAQPADPNQEVYATATAIISKYGVKLEQGDPEAEMFKSFTAKSAEINQEYADNPEVATALIRAEYFATVKKMAAAKAVRTSKPNGAVVPTIGGGATTGNAIASVTDTDALFKMAKSKI